MPIVYVVNKGNHIYESASKFGEIKYLTEGKQNIFALNDLCDRINTVLSEITTQDYLLISGHILPNVIAINSIIKKLGSVKLLVWFAYKNMYRFVTLS